MTFGFFLKKVARHRATFFCSIKKKIKKNEEIYFFFIKTPLKKENFVIFGVARDVAQSGRASALGAECRQFESGYPDKKVSCLLGADFFY